MKIDLDLKQSLLNTPLHEYLNEEELNRFIAHTQIVTFNKGETIISQGKNIQGLYIIIEGQAAIYTQFLGEGLVTLGVLMPGYLIGETCLLDHNISTNSVIADSKMICLFITPAYIDLLSLFFPKTKYHFFKMIAQQIGQRLVHAHERIASTIIKSDIKSRSIFTEVINSLTKPTAITKAEAELNLVQLRNSVIFSRFTDQEFEILLNQFHFLKAAKHCPLIYAGDKASSCYIILHGAVQSSIVENNKIAKISVLGPLTLFTTLIYINAVPAAIFNYTTCERVILLELTASDLQYLEKTHHALWYKMYDLFCASFAELERAVDKLETRLNSELYNR